MFQELILREMLQVFEHGLHINQRENLLRESCYLSACMKTARILRHVCSYENGRQTSPTLPRHYQEAAERIEFVADTLDKMIGLSI